MILQERRFTVAEFERMATAILAPEERVELIEGRIIPMSPMGSRHMACVNDLTEWLILHLGQKATVSVQNAVQLNDYSEPQPDVAILKRRARNYRDHIPTVEDVLWLIEVADTSESYDREVKLPLYAQAGVPEVWLISLNAGQLERYQHPSANGYQSLSRYMPTDAVPCPLSTCVPMPGNIWFPGEDNTST